MRGFRLAFLQIPRFYYQQMKQDPTCWTLILVLIERLVIEDHSFGRRDGVPDIGRLEQGRLRSIAHPPAITKDKMLVGRLVKKKAIGMEGEIREYPKSRMRRLTSTTVAFPRLNQSKLVSTSAMLNSKSLIA